MLVLHPCGEYYLSPNKTLQKENGAKTSRIIREDVHDFLRYTENNPDQKKEN